MRKISMSKAESEILVNEVIHKYAEINMLKIALPAFIMGVIVSIQQIPLWMQIVFAVTAIIWINSGHKMIHLLCDFYKYDNKQKKQSDGSR
jgi:hypothetical protein